MDRVRARRTGPGARRPIFRRIRLGCRRLEQAAQASATKGVHVVIDNVRVEGVSAVDWIKYDRFRESTLEKRTAHFTECLTMQQSHERSYAAVRVRGRVPQNGWQ